MPEEVAFTMAPVTGARRARVIRSPVCRSSITLDAEGSSLGLHQWNQP